MADPNPGQSSDSPASAPRAAEASLAPKHELMLIVVGSSIAAEIIDRPLAQRLRERTIARLSGLAMDAARPVLCTDLWYLNDRELDEQPVIALGDPARNAATAMLCARLPTALVIDRKFRVHLDPEFVDDRPQAALWGTDPESTEAAIDVFVERYLDGFLAARW